MKAIAQRLVRYTLLLHLRGGRGKVQVEFGIGGDSNGSR